MEFLTVLWVPILVTSIALFFVSSIAWTVMPHHNKDYAKLPDEDAMIKFLKTSNIQPGRYLYPNAGSHKGAQSEEMKAKFNEGPFGTLTVFGKVSMGQNLLLTFLYFVIISTLLAYLAWISIEGGDKSFIRIFRVVGTAGILTFCAGAIPNDIWFKRPMAMNLLDGIAYGLTAGIVFASLWPAT